MASLPTYTAAGRTRSSDGVTSNNNDAVTIEGTSLQTPDSTEDTETVFLNKSTSTTSVLENVAEVADKATGRPSNQQDTTQEEPRKCWICYTDETEDSPLNLEWRSPCPCALTAHEACLLDWLADLENPRSRRRTGGAKIECPQCKSRIIVTRPRSYVVDALRMAERVAGRLVLPGMAFTLAGTVWAGCCAHGAYSMHLIFGAEEAMRILEESREGPWTPGMNIGLPLIPLVLIFSRTRYAEGLLPAIPVLFFAVHSPAHEAADLDFWPPTPAITFAALPYVKSFYGALYDRLFGALERKWIAEVQPRAAEEILDDAQQQDQAEGLNRFGDNVNGQILMEIDLELQVGMGNDDELADALALPADDNDGADTGAQDGQARAGQNNGQGMDLGRRQNEIIHDTGNITDIVLGALVFPAISASVGGLLKYVLPKAWTTPSSVLERSRPGLLQTRWGRSVVGGCMFVLLKDALVLYCRWKLAQTHRRRKVLNYDRSKARKQGSAKR
ncbi:hypothetical protein N7454_010031 [Penicillium verhagenii]|nr:hypothetical protein N7454_010031 [Penicillium verhagenii]